MSAGPTHTDVATGLRWKDTAPGEVRLVPSTAHDCGHPAACVVSGCDGTRHCGWCEDTSMMHRALAEQQEAEETSELMGAERDRAVALLREVTACHVRGAAGWHGTDARAFASVLTRIEAELLRR